MGYFLFILVTATLFVRPAEIFPAVYAWPIYEWLILACLAVSLPGVLRQLSTKSLSENPITACVIGLWAAVVLSHLVHFSTYEARTSGFEFFKIVVYYLLLVANVNSEQRLKSFLRWLLLLITLIAVISLLSAYHVIELPGGDFMMQGQYDKATGQVTIVPRLQSTGIFNNPNNLAMILVPGVVIALYFAADPAAGIMRPLGLGLVGLFSYAIYGTQSRGGLLALLAALLTLCLARWGWKRAVLIGAVVVPVLLVAFGGRMTDIDHAMAEDTGKSRVQIWSEGFGLFRQQPLFGIGHGNFQEEVKIVAHNSFLQYFTELGLFGGSLFLGAFIAAFVMLYRLQNWGLSQFLSDENGTVPLPPTHGELTRFCSIHACEHSQRVCSNLPGAWTCDRLRPVGHRADGAPPSALRSSLHQDHGLR
jgi:O-antigen ligase